MSSERRGVWARRGAVGTLGVSSALWMFASMGACSSNPPQPFGETSEAGGDAGGPTFEDAPGTTPPADDQYVPPIDAAPPLTCPGVAVPPEASTACTIDTSASCSSCASWGFACPTWSSPQFQDAQASTAASFCLAHAIDAGDAGGALICCTLPACIVSVVVDAGGCDASTATHYVCTGGAVPNGTCTWSGASAPNDYCCE